MGERKVTSSRSFLSTLWVRGQLRVHKTWSQKSNNIYFQILSFPFNGVISGKSLHTLPPHVCKNLTDLMQDHKKSPFGKLAQSVPKIALLNRPGQIYNICDRYVYAHMSCGWGNPKYTGCPFACNSNSVEKDRQWLLDKTLDVENHPFMCVS